MRLGKARSMALADMRTYGLTGQGWRFKWSYSGTRAGSTIWSRYGTSYITLSAPLTRKLSEDQVRVVIRHEVAHALDKNRHGHSSPAWKKQAKHTGAPPKKRYLFKG